MDRTLQDWNNTRDTTTYSYDNLDRTLSVTLPPVENPDTENSLTTSTATTLYDLNSNPVRGIDHNGHASATFYDQFSRPTVSVVGPRR